MEASNDSGLAAVRRKRRIAGAIAIALLLLFTVLAIIRVFSLIEWVIGDLIVALVANFILSRVGRQKRSK